MFDGKSGVPGGAPVISIPSGWCFDTGQWIVCVRLTTCLVSALFAVTSSTSGDE